MVGFSGDGRGGFKIWKTRNGILGVGMAFLDIDSLFIHLGVLVWYRRVRGMKKDGFLPGLNL
jgi:hypothetical protein